LVLRALEIQAEDQVEVVYRGVAIVTRSAAGGGVPMDAVSVRGRDCAALAYAVVVGIVPGEDVSSLKPVDQLEIDRRSGDGGLFMGIRAASRIVEVFVVNTLSGRVGPVGSPLHAGISGQEQVAGGVTNIVDVGRVGERGRRGGLDDRSSQTIA